MNHKDVSSNFQGDYTIHFLVHDCSTGGIKIECGGPDQKNCQDPSYAYNASGYRVCFTFSSDTGKGYIQSF